MVLCGFRLSTIVRGMKHKKPEKAFGAATLGTVKKEMSKPRMSRVRKNSGTETRYWANSGTAKASVSGIVDKIIVTARPSQPEQAQIKVDVPTVVIRNSALKMR